MAVLEFVFELHYLLTTSNLFNGFTSEIFSVWISKIDYSIDLLNYCLVILSYTRRYSYRFGMLSLSNSWNFFMIFWAGHKC